MNGFSTGEEDSRGPTDQICCLIDESERCKNAAGNASYSKRVQKTVTSRRLKLNIDPQVRDFPPTHTKKKNVFAFFLSLFLSGGMQVYAFISDFCFVLQFWRTNV